MDQSLQAQIDIYLPHLNALIRRGRTLHETLTKNPSELSALATNRLWHQDLGVTINQLSGGSKAHWLARSFSEAFLLRSTDGRVVEGAAPAEIIERLIHVLEQAVSSLSRMGNEHVVSASAPVGGPPPRRFEFVHNAELRPVVEQAYSDSRDALEQGSFELALITSCGILEAIVTDALEHRGLSALAPAGVPEGKIVDWSFDARLVVAEKAGLIRGGCARLPDIARSYRDLNDDAGSVREPVSEHDARRAMQVLHVVMRDLDPGR